MKPGPAPHTWRSEPTVILPDTTWAYIAGVFDGEGSIARPVNRRGVEAQFVGWRLSISQRTDSGLCQWIKATLTYGTLTVHTQPRPNEVSNWRCNAQMEVKHFLEHTLPYLIVKKSAATEAYDHLLQTCMKWVTVQ